MRNGAERGESNLPGFGELLAATEDGGPTALELNVGKAGTKIVGIFICQGEGGGPAVSVTRPEGSLLGFRTDGCDAENIYSGESQPIKSSAPATLKVTAPPGVHYALVIEAVA